MKTIRAKRPVPSNFGRKCFFGLTASVPADWGAYIPGGGHAYHESFLMLLKSDISSNQTIRHQS
jgi:hypothetical protein